MPPDRRKPPDGHGRLSESVLADGFDALRDNPKAPKKQVSSTPPDFDPAACPILAEHFFGTEGAPPVGKTTAEVATGLRRQRQIANVYFLGVRAVAEMRFEVADGEDLDRTLQAYERLTPDLLKAMGGDRFPAAPLHEVPAS